MEDGRGEVQNDRIETDYQSFSKRKSTQSGRCPADKIPDEKQLDNLAQSLGKELINRSNDVSHIEVTKTLE